MKFEPVAPNPDLDIHPDPPGLWGRVAVACRWWDAKRGRREYPHAAVVGPLRTERGIDELVRNLLANPQIRVLIVCGPDLTPGEATTAALEVLWTHRGAFPQAKRWLSDSLIEMAREASGGGGLAHLDELHVFTGVHLVPPPPKGARPPRFYCPGTGFADPIAERGPWAIHYNTEPTGEEDIEAVVRYDLVDEDRPGGKHVIEAPPVKQTDRAPHGDPGERIVADTLEDLWPRVLQRIMLAGREAPTQYGPTRELLNLVTVVRDPKAVATAVWGGVEGPEPDEVALQTMAYYDRLKKAEPPDGAPYTYGSRLRGWGMGPDPYDPREPDSMGSRHVDQIVAINRMLGRNPDTRAAFLTPWRPDEDAGKESGRPCMIAMWFRIVDGEMHATVGFRSHDMFSGWRMNIAAVCMLLTDWATMPILEGVKPGTVTCMSYSAHIYERDWNAATELIEAYKRKGLRWDQRSTWVVDWSEKPDSGQDRPGGLMVRPPKAGTLRATALTPDGGSVLRVFEARTPEQLRASIEDSGLVTELGNALWLGAEIARVYAQG